MSNELKVKVIVPKGMSDTEADEALRKAVNSHADGSVHDEDSFDDESMVDIQDKLIKKHEELYKVMLAEISKALDGDYT